MTGTTQLASTPADEELVDLRLGEVVDDLRRRAVRHDAGFRETGDALVDVVIGGKKVRPALLLAAFRGLTGDERDPAVAIEVACAIELLHAAFLVHDDVIDHDLVRRGAPNVGGHAVERATRLGAGAPAAEGFGAAAGIIVGDLLLSAALSLVGACEAPATTRCRIVRLVEDTIVATAAGEHADAWSGLRLHDVGPDEALRTVELKTARYSFQAPLEAAAVLADADPARSAALAEIGRGLGIAYQLRDDVLGVFGSPGTTGKSVVGDLREGKQTLLVALARTSPAWDAVAPLFGDPGLTEDGARRLRDVLRTTGALARVEQSIDARCTAVRAHVTEADLPPALEAFLLDLALRCTERDS